MKNDRSSLTPSSPPSSTRRLAVLALVLAGLAAATIPGCGSSSPADPGGPPTPTPTPTPSQPVACSLTAPTVDCANHPPKPQELAPVLQEAVDVAMGTPGTMYADPASRIYDLDKFRARTIAHLTAAGVCGAWDYGNEKGDEIYVRTGDGCVAEQYDLITGEGGVRPVNKGSNSWQEGWGVPVPGPKPNFSKEGDVACSLPGDRSTFCFGIRNTQGAYGAEIYALLVEVMIENPGLFDKNDFAAGQGEFVPEQLRVAAWRILDQDAYIAAVEAKLRSRGFCATIDLGDILKAKKVQAGNVFHEEMDVVQNPASGGSYASFVIKDRCHNAGF